MGAAAALVFAPAREITTSIEITATPAQVWAVLADTQAYAVWNPDMRLVGKLQAGQVIEHDEGQGPDRMVFHPTVLSAVPGQELRWFGRIWFWHVLNAEHVFSLVPDGARTRFVQGEHFRGVVLWFYDVGQLLPGFEAMNRALKQRVEAQSQTD